MVARQKLKGCLNGQGEYVSVPKPFSDIINEVCNRDIEHFKNRQNCKSFLRPYIPGEFWPFIYPYDTLIEVTQIFPGLRTRVPHRIKKTGEIVPVERWTRLFDRDSEITIIPDDGGS